MKLNEKIKNYIIICLGALLIITGIFATCNIHGDSGTTSGIRKSIERSISTACFIAESYSELVRISDQFGIDIEQLRTENTNLERTITELRENNKRLTEYKSTLEQTIRDIIDANNGIADGVDGIAEIIQRIRESAETEAD